MEVFYHFKAILSVPLFLGLTEAIYSKIIGCCETLSERIKTSISVFIKLIYC